MSQDLCDVDELLISSEGEDSDDEFESILKNDDECETDDESTDIIENQTDVDRTMSITDDIPTIVIQETNNNPILQWNGQPLFPPSSRKMKHPSVVWKFGGFLKVDGKLDLSNTICGLCGKCLPYQNSPGNFQRHLEKHHGNELQAEKSLKNDKMFNENPKITSHFMSSSKTAIKKYNPNNVKQRAFRKKLGEWVVANIRPFSIVEDSKFRDLISIADPQITVVSSRTVCRDIVKLFKVKKTETKDELKNVEFICGTTDAGSSLAGKTYIDLNLHWIDSKTFEARKKTINVQKVDSKTAEDYREVVDDALDDHGVKGKTLIFTTDNEATMRKCFENEIRNGCFSHIESKASQKALDSSVRLKTLRLKLRKIAKKSNKSSKFKAMIQKEQMARNLRVLTIKQEIATRFTCTYDMFRSILNDPNDGKNDPADRVKVDLNIEAINVAMNRLFTKKVYKVLEIKSSDVDLMLKLMETLEILEEGIRTLGGENYSSGSSVLPFLVQFSKVLEDNDEDPVYVSKFKQMLSSELTDRCKKNLNFSMLAKASFFDKRFSKLGFLSNNDFPLDKEEYKEQIVDEISNELEEVAFELENHPEPLREVEDDAPNPKKAKFLDGICEDSVDDGSNKNDAKEELSRYMLEKNIPANESPLKWWRRNRDIYPLMSKLALKYLCIQATSTAAERSFSLLGNILTKKRMSLSDQNVNILTYLSDCL